MIVPNWMHHSKKNVKRTLKPQALRQSRARLRSLLTKLNHDSQSTRQGRNE